MLYFNAHMTRDNKEIARATFIRMLPPNALSEISYPK